MKEKVKELLNKINREGIEELKAFLENSDFYEAPASKDIMERINQD